MKTVLCPRCKRGIYKHDEKGTMVIKALCGQCLRVVRYDPTTGETSLERKPERQSISGTRFW